MKFSVKMVCDNGQIYVGEAESLGGCFAHLIVSVIRQEGTTIGENGLILSKQLAEIEKLALMSAALDSQMSQCDDPDCPIHGDTD